MRGMMRDPENPRESLSPRLPEPTKEIVLMTEAEKLFLYLDSSHETRLAYGVTKTRDGGWQIVDLEKFQLLESWQKDVLRSLGKISEQEKEVMAIPRNHKVTGFIDRPGEYRVRVEKLEVTNSKAGKQMLVITFQADDERRIKGYYVKDLPFHMKALDDLKLAAGVPLTSSAEMLQGKRVGIAVGQQPETPDGKIFMAIEGYGKEADVEAAASHNDFSPSQGHADMDVPF